MPDTLDRTRLIRRICERDDLSTYDPYDIWKTSLGFHTKNFYNHHRVLGLPGAACLTIVDLYLNENVRLFYKQQEYPIVRALAALSLLKLFERLKDPSLLESVRGHLDWLRRNSCIGLSGPCWGLGFRYAVGKNLIYDVNTPLTTMTPYALEAFAEYTRLSGDESWLPMIQGVLEFLENDVVILEDADDYLVTSYSNIPDRTVTNAVSYTMFSYGLLYSYVEVNERGRVTEKIRKLYEFVRRNQNADGSWLYSPATPSFVDCFHSCIIIKNLIKTANIVNLDGCQKIISRGYQYLKENLFVAESGLVKRFAKTDKPGLIRFDLYDNAEMLNLAHLMGDSELARNLDASIVESFVKETNIYSQIDWLGIKHGPNMLRWAVMPYVYALAVLESSVSE